MAEAQPPTPPPTAPPAQGVLSTVTNVASNVASTVSETAQGVVAKTTEVVRETTAKYGFMVIVAILIAVILFFLAYWLYTYLSATLTNKVTKVIKETTVPRKGTDVSQIKGGNFPTMTNGNRVTYTFWMYIHDINQLSGPEMRHVLHIGDESQTGGSPSVYLDGRLNKLYIRFDSTTGSATSFEKRLAEFKNAASTDTTVQNEKVTAGYASRNTTTGAITSQSAVSENDAILIDLATRGIVIDYIPLQRWVHVAVVVNETVNRGYISAYLDGELVKSISSLDKVTLSNGRSVPISFQNLALMKAGDLYIGGNPYNVNNSKGFSGIVSKVTISNYDLNGEEIKDIYVQGPLDTLSSKLGLPAYGLRSPIYRVG